MESELKRGLFRIMSNYGRLFASIILSLSFFPILLGVIGDDGVSLILLFGSTTGLAAMCQEFVRRSMIRELGVAQHTHSPEEFREVFQSAVVVSIGAATIAASVFTVLWFLIPIFNLGGDSEHFDDGARALLIARGLASIATILTAPIFNMILIKERMLVYNCWLLVIDRGQAFIAAIVLALLFKPFIEFTSQGVVLFAWMSGGITIAAVLLSSAIEVFRDRRLMPGIRMARSIHVKNIIQTSGWNGAIIAAMNLYMRVDVIIMNLAFGLFGNLIFGFAMLMTGYARRLTVGMTDGLDAVGARIASRDESQIGELLKHSSRLHAIVAFPTGLFVALLADPLLRLWLAQRLGDPEATVPSSALLIQILTAGIVVRSISDSWIRTLYGVGHIKKYAPIVLLGGLLNPGLAILLIWLITESSGYEWIGPAVATAVILVPVHGIAVPWITAKVTGSSLRSILAPLLRPLVAAILASGALVIARITIEDWNLWSLAVTSVVYGAIYLALSVVITMNNDDRKVFLRMIRYAQKRSVPR